MAKQPKRNGSAEGLGSLVVAETDVAGPQRNAARDEAAILREGADILITLPRKKRFLYEFPFRALRTPVVFTTTVGNFDSNHWRRGADCLGQSSAAIVVIRTELPPEKHHGS
ncbi:MAG: hypothetical protein ACREIP_18800 [Alphaproteobacteria bacterium]